MLSLNIFSNCTISVLHIHVKLLYVLQSYIVGPHNCEISGGWATDQGWHPRFSEPCRADRKHFCGSVQDGAKINLRAACRRRGKRTDSIILDGREQGDFLTQIGPLWEFFCKSFTKYCVSNVWTAMDWIFVILSLQIHMLQTWQPK